MNRKKLHAILAIESVLIILVCVLTGGASDQFTSIWGFPFAQIGEGLIALHELGSVGAGIACALWIGLSLLPVIPAVCGRGKTPWERALLVLFALSVCAALYFTTNPIKLMTPYDETGSFSKLMFSTTAWSVLILYFVVRIVRLLREGDRDKLTGYFYTALAAGFNVLQVLFLDSLSHVVTTMQIPVFSIAFTLFALLFTRIIVENRKLRDDNEIFI